MPRGLGAVGVVIVVFSLAGIILAGVVFAGGWVEGESAPEATATPSTDRVNASLDGPVDTDDRVIVTFRMVCEVPWCYDPPNGTLVLEFQRADMDRMVWVGTILASIDQETAVKVPLEPDTRHRILVRAPTGEAIVAGEYVATEPASVTLRIESRLVEIPDVTPASDR